MPRTPRRKGRAVGEVVGPKEPPTADAGRVPERVSGVDVWARLGDHRDILLGRVATGIVHDLLNPLSAVEQGLQLLAPLLDPTHPRFAARWEKAGLLGPERDRLAQALLAAQGPHLWGLVHDAAKRGVAQVQAISAFAARREPVPGPVSFGQVIADAWTLCRQDPLLRERTSGLDTPKGFLREAGRDELVPLSSVGSGPDGKFLEVWGRRRQLAQGVAVMMTRLLVAGPTSGLYWRGQWSLAVEADTRLVITLSAQREAPPPVPLTLDDVEQAVLDLVFRHVHGGDVQISGDEFVMWLPCPPLQPSANHSHGGHS